MHRDISTRLAVRLAPTLTVVVAALLAPLTLLPTIWDTTRTRLRDAYEDESGVSELVVVALLAGLAAIAVVGYMVIVKTKVTNEANNLPTSGG